MLDEVYISFHFNIILNTTGCPLLSLTKPQFSYIRIHFTIRQNSAAGNTSLSRPILQVRTVCEFMCA
jgi:hypothetical protein